MIIKLVKFGEILISRPSGREAFLAMQAYLIKDLKTDEEIIIDFSKVKVLTPSWADEVLTKLTEKFKNIKFINTDNPTVKSTLDILKQYSGLKI